MGLIINPRKNRETPKYPNVRLTNEVTAQEVNRPYTTIL